MNELSSFDIYASTPSSAEDAVRVASIYVNTKTKEITFTLVADGVHGPFNTAGLSSYLQEVKDLIRCHQYEPQDVVSYFDTALREFNDANEGMKLFIQ